MTFNDLNLTKPLLDALTDLGFSEPTPIQHKGFSTAMSGRDMVGIAQTGTGKTLAYLLPCLRQWTFSKEGHPQILILVPTRELVVQIVEEVEKLTKYMNVVVVGVYGGANINPQMDTLAQGLDVLVATPGRLLDLILKNAVKMKALKRLVIDEVDEMMSLGFRPQLTRVLDFLPKSRQNLMFSATMTEEIEALMFDFFRTPQIIEAAPTGTPLSNIQQTGYLVPNFNTKTNLLERILPDPALTKVLVFVESRRIADLLYDRILPKFEAELGIIHSNKAQQKRFETVSLFKNGTYRILIATDIIARGLDIAEVSHVINFDTPEVPEDYIHRIGRTGRADKTGIAMTFINEQEEEYQAAIEELMQHSLEILPLPDDLEISEVLIPEEKPTFTMKSPKIIAATGGAFHQKLAKNTKVNVRMGRTEKMKMKYKKPQKRAPKKK